MYLFMCGTHLQNNYHAEILKCELSSPECAEYDSTCVLITDFFGGLGTFPSSTAERG